MSNKTEKIASEITEELIKHLNELIDIPFLSESTEERIFRIILDILAEYIAS